MAFVFVVLSALLAVASAGVLSPITYAHAHVGVANPAVDAVASTHENVVRSFGGTVSQYSKAVDTPYSSVHKEDTRISNNVYTPAIAKTVTYAAPAHAHAHAHAHAPAVYTHAAPVLSKAVYSAPTHPVYEHHEAAPAVYTHAAPAPTAAAYAHAAPATAKTLSYAAPAPTHVYHHEVPQAHITYNHGPAAAAYSHQAPGVAAYGSSQTVHYSPAEMVSHMSFDGFGTHWGF